MASPRDERPIEAWATRLSGKGEPLTRQEAQLLSGMATADRLVELLAVLQDMQIRLQRMEIFLSEVFPTYDQTVRLRLQLGAAMRPQPETDAPEPASAPTDVVAVSRTVPAP